MFRNPLNQPTRTQRFNKKINLIKRGTGVKNIRSLPNFDKILSENPYRQKVTGYYVVIPLSEYKTFVPDGRIFPDRYGNYYQGGQFDVPLFTNKEWRDKWGEVYPNADKPELLVNGNWFNVWPNGIPNEKDVEKINPRKQARTFLIGLSISNGDRVSTHKVLDQDNKGLDTIIFDLINNKASIIPHDNIDVEIEKIQNFYDNKNAVSGFILLQNKTKIKTPDLNNNASIRLPRTGIGLKNDGKNIVVMVIHNPDKSCGVTADEFTNLFEELNCTDAINLDNSGSVELFYEGLNEFGEPVTVSTKTCDAGAPSERPKPNFVGFSNVSKLTFFANDDSDVPTKKHHVKTKIAKADDDVTYTRYNNNKKS